MVRSYSRWLAIPLCAGAILLAGCPDPHKKYMLDPLSEVVDSEGERAARAAAPFADELVRYLSGESREDGNEFVLRVEFEPGGFAPQMDTLREIEALLVIMRDFPTLRVAIEGHTDNAGDPDKNQKLSGWRAEWVRQFLIERGIAEERVQAEGFGDSHPIADNGTPEGQQQNRRLVVRILNFETNRTSVAR